MSTPHSTVMTNDGPQLGVTPLLYAGAMAAVGRPIVRFRRTISTALETALGPGGPLNWLVTRVSAPDSGLDLQLRSSGGSTSWVSLYAGMTSVLDVYDNSGGLSLRVHPTHRAAGAFDELWSAPQSPAKLGDQHESVDAYLDRILADGAINPR